MRIGEIKKRMREEAETATPDVSERVVKSSYIEKPSGKTDGVSKKRNMKIAFSSVAAVLVLAIAVTTGVYLGRPKATGPVSGYYYANFVLEKGAAAAAEDDGPATVSFTFDSAGNLESARGDDKYGDMVLRVAGELSGNYSEITEKILDAGRRLGYVGENAGIIVTAAGEKAVKLLDGIKAEVEVFAGKCNIDVSVSGIELSKSELYNKAAEFSQNVTSSMSFEELNTAFASRKSFIEESWERGDDIISDIYYDYIVTVLNETDPEIIKYFETFKNESFNKMKETLSGISDNLQTVGKLLPVELRTEIDSVVETIDMIIADTVDTVKRIYNNYIVKQIDIIQTALKGDIS